VDRPEWIEVGRVARPHGVHGELRVLSSSDNPERFVPGSVVHARPVSRLLRNGRGPVSQQPRTPGLGRAPGADAPVRLTVESVRGTDELPIVAFEEVTTRDEAAALNGYVLEVRASDLPELDEDEYYPFDLIGLEVRTPEGGVAGTVTDIVESPAHDLLVVALGGAPGAPDEPGRAGVQQGDGRPLAREVLIPFVQEAVPAVSLADGFLIVEAGFLAGPEGATQV
jgi:16S rRNA processing protein RimM